MPSSTPKQARFMRAVSHGFKPDQFKGPPVSVAKEFEAADERKHKKGFAHGGTCYACGGRVDHQGLAEGGEVPEWLHPMDIREAPYERDVESLRRAPRGDEPGQKDWSRFDDSYAQAVKARKRKP